MRRKLRLALLTTGIALAGARSANAACPPLPHTIINGQVADATQIMENFNDIKTCLDTGQLLVPPVTSISVIGLGSTAVTVQNPSGTTNYNFNLPVSSGALGQILVSGGGGSNPMSWATIPGTVAPPVPSGIPTGRPPAASFVWRNPGGASFIEHTNGPITLLIPAQNNDQIRGFEQAALLSTPYTLTVKLDSLLWDSQFFTAGIYVADNSGKLLAFDVEQGNIVRVGRWNSTTSVNSQAKFTTVMPSPTWWFRIENDGANWIFSISHNGADWVPFYSEPLTAFLGSSISALGVYGNNNDTNGIGINSTISIWSFELAPGLGTDSHW